MTRKGYDLVGNRTEKRHTEALPGGGFDISIRCYKYNQGHQLVLEYEESGSLQEGTVMGKAGDLHSGLASITVSGTPATQWGAYFAGSGPSDTSNYVQVIATDHVGNHAIIPLMVTTGLSDFVSYRYDENGNLIERLSSEDGPTFYEWDHKNRLTKVTHPDGGETTYEYCPACPLGKLSKMTRKDASTVEWTWDGLSMVEEADTREGDSAYFSGLAVQRNGAWYYLFMDAMGSVFQVTDETGALVNEFDWDAWGNELTGTFTDGTAVCQIGWQGKRWDEEQGLFYSVARWYDQRTGRFTQPDPAEGVGIVAVGGEGYGWPGNCPVTLLDPFGLATAEEELELIKKWYEEGVRSGLLGSYPEDAPKAIPPKLVGGRSIEYLKALLSLSDRSNRACGDYRGFVEAHFEWFIDEECLEHWKIERHGAFPNIGFPQNVERFVGDLPWSVIHAWAEVVNVDDPTNVYVLDPFFNYDRMAKKEFFDPTEDPFYYGP